MKPTRAQVQEMVLALFTLMGGIQRASRASPNASALALLQMISARGRVHPSEMAGELGLNQSSITRQVQTLEAEGYVAVTGDPDDRRSTFLTLTRKGKDRLHKLNEMGLDRFSLFVADWDAEDVRTFTQLLQKLETSKAAVAAREKRPVSRRRPNKRERNPPRKENL